MPDPSPSFAKTVIYVHGIGNKPTPSVLKCQWDQALFGVDLGERSRLAYWVNQDFYPEPLTDTCAAGDLTTVEADSAASTTIRALSGEADLVDREIEVLGGNEKERAILRRIAAKVEQRGVTKTSGLKAADVEAKILPLPAPLRRWITRQLTRAFLRDVHHFLFDEGARARMRASLRERLDAGGGPFVVVAHSQGSLIAYDVLRELAKNECDVRLFVTIGSPLGLDEVQDVFKKWTHSKQLPFPPCVTRWINVADRFDPVAADPDLSGEFHPGTALENHDKWGLNPDSLRHPHSATGYLRTKYVRLPVREVVGSGFAQEVLKFVIARDLVRDLEDAGQEERRPVLIELVEPQGTRTIDHVRKKLMPHLKKLPREAEIEELKRFVAARLTRSEVETLRVEMGRIAINHVWRDAVKRILIADSTNTIQCRPAHQAYGAKGRNIRWAVLDTGIRASHPHFQRASNIEAQWDCSKRGAPVEASGKDIDAHGHGTHVAAIIAGGMTVKRRQSADGVQPAGEIEIAGMAPDAKIHSYKVLDDDGEGSDSWVIKALDHIAEVNERAGTLAIHGVNLSLGGSFDPSVYGCGHTPLCRELRRLWRQGVIVVLAAGNEGYAVLQGEEGNIEMNLDLSIGDPANLDEAISVGSVHRTDPHTYGISWFSSRGPTADGRMKPDLVAPGEKIVSACHQYSGRKESLRYEDLYVEMSGTSMAAPHVSGLLAAFLSLRREFIGYPDRVKEILTDNCTDLRRDRYIQGHGMPNLVKMLVSV
ncbi:MAG TPA: S8 family peptidase [Thermoanaerobaculia bacterium]|nr:S8 family peptidase [Thermoanaerobaculia bacterium]